MNIYTAHYRYSDDDRLDITVKGNLYPGNVLAPTWDMVKGYSAGTLSDWGYATQYFSLVISRFYTEGIATRGAFTAILNNHHEQLTLVCFCPVGNFCHRILAARMLENMGCGKYIGERQL